MAKLHSLDNNEENQMTNYTLTLIDGDNSGYNIDVPVREFLQLRVELAEYPGREFKLETEWKDGMMRYETDLVVIDLANVMTWLSDELDRTGEEYFENLFSSDGEDSFPLTFSK